MHNSGGFTASQTPPDTTQNIHASIPRSVRCQDAKWAYHTVLPVESFGKSIISWNLSRLIYCRKGPFLDTFVFFVINSPRKIGARISVVKAFTTNQLSLERRKARILPKLNLLKTIFSVLHQGNPLWNNKPNLH
jgi:hypothetical protein